MERRRTTFRTLLLVAVVAYFWGGMTVYKQIFPYSQVHFLKKKYLDPQVPTSQVLQIFRWLIATLNNVSNIQPKTLSFRRRRIRPARVAREKED